MLESALLEKNHTIQSRRKSATVVYLIMEGLIIGCCVGDSLTAHTGIANAEVEYHAGCAATDASSAGAGGRKSYKNRSNHGIDCASGEGK